MLLRHFGQAQAGEAVLHNGGTVNVQRCAPYPAPFQFRSPHPSSHAFNNQAFLQFYNRSDDYDHRTAQWPAGVNVFTQTHKLDVQVTEFIEYFQEVANVSGNSVERGDQHDRSTHGENQTLTERRTAAAKPARFNTIGREVEKSDQPRSFQHEGLAAGKVHRSDAYLSVHLSRNSEFTGD